MAIWLQENWIIALAGVLVLLALIVWRWSRRGSAGDGAPAIAPAAPRAPLAPVKPEIIAAEPARFAAPHPVPVPVPVAPIEPVSPPPVMTEPVGEHDNLALLKGVGPKLVVLLGSLGVVRFDQIAAWTDADIAAIDPQLGAFQGRITRDNWIDQAGYLAKGDKAGFEAKYGALGSEI